MDKIACNLLQFGHSPRFSYYFAELHASCKLHATKYERAHSGTWEKEEKIDKNYRAPSFPSNISLNFRCFLQCSRFLMNLCSFQWEPMILDGLPLELMKEVLLELPTVDIIQTVKCTRRLYNFVKADKRLGRRLQGRVADLELCLGGNTPCETCGKLVRILRFLI